MRVPVVLLLGFGLSACGAVDNFNDAAPSNIDAAHPLDAQPTVGTANVTTYDFLNANPTTPLAGVDVVVVAPDGTQRDLQVSDANGQSTVNVHTGDSISALYTATQHLILTYASVKPGDHIVIGLGSLAGGSQVPTGTANISVNNSGATTYSVTAACTSNNVTPGTPVTMQFYSTCAATSPLIYVAYNAAGQISNWARVENTSTTGTVTVPAPTWQAPTGFTLSASGLPAEVTNVSLNLSDALSRNYSVGIAASGAPTNGSFSSGPNQPFVRASENYVGSAEFVRDNSQYGYQIFTSSVPMNSVAYSVTNPALLPWFGMETFDQPSETLSVSADGGGGAYETQLFDFQWYRTSPDAGTSDRWEWFSVVPAGTTTYQLPAIGGADAYVMPQATDSFGSFSQMYAVHYPDATSYDDVRAKAIGDILSFEFGQNSTNVSTSANPPTLRGAAPRFPLSQLQGGH